MANIGDDCYFFCTATCSKGSTCMYRHVEAAKTAKIICQHWKLGGCFRPNCLFRHSEFRLAVVGSDVPCYWETQPIGCRKPNCTFKHLKPRNLIVPNTNSTVSTTAPVTSTLAPATTSSTTNTAPTTTTTIDANDAKALQTSTESTTKLATKNEIVSDAKSDSIDNSSNRNDDDQSGKTKEEKTSSISENIEEKETTKSIDTDGSKRKPSIKKNSTKTKIVKAKKKKENVLTKTKNNTKMKSVKKQPKLTVKPSQTNNRPKKSPVQAKVSVKNRLGLVKPVTRHSSASSDTNSSDSDEDLENIKILPMEEILRQKALESMMKKQNVSSVKQREIKKRVDTSRKEESISEEESQSVSENEEYKEETEEESSAQDSSSDSSSSSSDNEPDARRVVVDFSSEKTARKKAKTSMLNMRQKNTTEKNLLTSKRKALLNSVPPTVLQDKQYGKRRKINVISPLKKQQSISSRLGRNIQPEKDVNSLSENDSSSELDRVEIKSLEEIKKEKMIKLSDSNRTLVLPDEDKNDSNSESNENRAVLVVSEDLREKKLKRRPWRKQPSQGSISLITEKAPTVVRSVTPPPPASELIKGSDISDESPFESLKRRALLRKRRAAEENRLKVSELPTAEENNEDESTRSNRQVVKKPDNTDDVDDVIPVSKKSKHKKKHKHKKTKTERQIYVPPAMKTTVLKNPVKEEDVEVEISSRRKGPHPIAAAWAAGLTLSSKGTTRRPLSPTSYITDPVPQKISKVFPLMSTNTRKEEEALSNESSSVEIKSFSEIMAEKRRRRQEQQELKKGTTTSDAASPSAQNQLKPKAPITPIIFNLENPISKAKDVSTDITNPFSKAKNDMTKNNKHVKATKKLFKRKSKLETTDNPNSVKAETENSANVPYLHKLEMSSKSADDKVKSSPLISPRIKSTESKRNASIIEDEFSFFEDDLENEGDVLTADVEPIDDLLQDIDDLLA